MSFHDLFSGHAKLYAAARPSYPTSLIAEIAALAPSRALAWDAGTGNGQSARLLAGHFDRVHATDASPQQVAEAEPHPRINFAAEPAEQCSLGDGTCDLVLVAQALHWFDLDRFYPEACRVLRPGGLLAAIGYGWFFVDPVVDEIVGRTLLKPLEPKWAPGNWLLIDGYRTIDFPGGEVRLTPSAAHLAWTREQLEAYVGSWSAVQRWDATRLADAFHELASVWPDTEARHVFMPVISRAARL
ncbi:class I SAM-dependent methyltransferase [Sphingomonas sp. BN140010]|uniref:Class I SAM-dependent methyltransferase n=1 Tax=Sphingomonas arvum TaxID=2992113 RepID=A0ABT3JDV4_9SPHN|nr:class I SAM-dependent methyltransferase [Sphingomonas sp. BN140010]MCW3797258.1 class I SAM-dependent methyltransferase [Sphingomonas sp. BN140010]